MVDGQRASLAEREAAVPRGVERAGGSYLAADGTNCALHETSYSLALDSLRGELRYVQEPSVFYDPLFRQLDEAAKVLNQRATTLVDQLQICAAADNQPAWHSP